VARANSSVNKRVWAVLEEEKPDRIPFISRMDFWHKGLAYQNKIPEKFGGMDLEEIHRSVGIGQEEWMSPHAFKYRNLELILYSEGEVIHQEHEPEIEFFPDLWGIIPVDRAGEITVELRTPAGKLTCLHRVTEDSIRSGTTRPQLVKHPVVESGDFKIY
jgi:hypothetical protein